MMMVMMILVDCDDVDGIVQDVKRVSWHPSEDLLASASYDNSVKLYRFGQRMRGHCRNLLATYLFQGILKRLWLEIMKGRR